jgi:hypothetical protein
MQTGPKKKKKKKKKNTSVTHTASMEPFVQA